MELSHAIDLYQAVQYADFPRITAQAESNLGNLLQRRAGKDLRGQRKRPSTWRGL